MNSLRAFLSNPDNKGRDGCFRCLLILRVVNRFSSVAPLIVSLSHEEDIFKVVGVASLEDSFLLEGKLFFFGKLTAGFEGGFGFCQLLSSEQPASAQQSGNNNSNCTHQIHIVFIFSTYSYSIIILIFVLIHHECILIVLIQIIIAKLVIVGITLFFGSTFYCGVIDLFFFGGLLPPPFSLPGVFLYFWVVVVDFFFVVVFFFLGWVLLHCCPNRRSSRSLCLCCSSFICRWNVQPFTTMVGVVDGGEGNVGQNDLSTQKRLQLHPQPQNGLGWSRRCRVATIEKRWCRAERRGGQGSGRKKSVTTQKISKISDL